MTRNAPRATLDADALDTLMPMHVRLDSEGRLRHYGPAFRRLAGERYVVDRPMTDVFDISRPFGIARAKDLLLCAGQRLHLTFREARPVDLRGILVPVRDGGAIVNLTLALSDLEDLGGSDLTCAHFPPTDRTLDMMYLMEANSLAMAETKRLINRLQVARSEAETKAFTDTLTGLGNRRALDAALASMIAAGTSFALAHVDLDFFKEVNDTLGHAAGDLVLQEAARVLRQATRHADHVARVGGDEFVILFEELVRPSAIDRIARRIVEELQSPIPYQGNVCRISASIGVVLSTDYDPPDPDQMIADADAALYASKRAGRSRYTLHVPGTPMAPGVEKLSPRSARP